MHYYFWVFKHIPKYSALHSIVYKVNNCMKQLFITIVKILNLLLYRFEKDLTPAGLAFFQCQWDESVQAVFHSVLRCAEPSYHFERPQPRVRPMSEFPEGEPFDEYVERYRDPVTTNELILRERLKACNIVLIFLEFGWYLSREICCADLSCFMFVFKF